MDHRAYLEKLERLDNLERRVKSLPDEFAEYKNRFIELLKQYREIYDMQLIESGDYPTF